MITSVATQYVQNAFRTMACSRNSGMMASAPRKASTL